jgi:hypothetical protein
MMARLDLRLRNVTGYANRDRQRTPWYLHGSRNIFVRGIGSILEE